MTPIAVSADDLQAWAIRGAPGDKMCYYRGYLPCDRRPFFASGKHSDDMRRVNQCASAALDLSNFGMIALAQHRNGDFDYDYYAILLPADGPARERARRKRFVLRPCRKRVK